MSVTLGTLKTALCGADGSQGIIQDSSYYGTGGADITTRINNAVTTIAGGIRLPDKRVSPPLPDLYDMDTVDTSTSDPYVDLPTDYMRHLFMVVDPNGNKLFPPSGGGYYDFALFLKRAAKKDLTQAGSISMVCVKGLKLYYQGIPPSSKTLTVHFYRKPTPMTDDADTVDGLPDHLAQRLIENYVAMDIFSLIEDGDNSGSTGYKIHEKKFYSALIDLVDWIGEDEEPIYYGESGFVDLGVCD